MLQTRTTLFLSYSTKSEVKELNMFIATFVRRLDLNVSRYSPKIDSLTSAQALIGEFIRELVKLDSFSESFDPVHKQR